MKKRIALVTLILLLVLSSNVAMAAPKENYSIKLLEYGSIEEYPKSGLVYGAHNQGTTYLPFFYNLIQNQDHNILVDIGFREGTEGGQKNWSELFGAKNIESPTEVLKKVNLTPEDIDFVILSHLHFDHAGNIDQFPNAHFYVQKEELTGWMSSLSLHPKIREWVWYTTDLKHINDLLAASMEGRVTLIDDEEYEVIDGIKAHSAKGHTFGTQAVTVETKKGIYALAQDVVYVYENARDYKPLGLGLDNLEQLMSIHKVNQLVDGNLDRIIPGHDYRVFDKFQTSLVGKNHVVTVIE